MTKHSNGLSSSPIITSSLKKKKKDSTMSISRRSGKSTLSHSIHIPKVTMVKFATTNVVRLLGKVQAGFGVDLPPQPTVLSSS